MSTKYVSGRVRELKIGITSYSETRESLSVVGRIVGAATSNAIPFLYSNYSDLPSATTYHGAFAHVHATQKAYFAHGGNWIELVNKDTNGNIVGDNSTNITGIAGVTASTLTGTLQTAAQPNITSLGTLSSLSVTGNVSVGGTLTYEDVTNVDAVGLITARSGVNISGGELKVGTGVTVGQSGIVSATAFSGNVNSQDGTASVLIPGAGTGDWSQLYNTVLYNSNGQAILTPTAGSEHFAGDSDGFTAGNASNLNAGTVPTVRLGSGTANSSSFLRGDQTWAAVTSTTINNNADNRLITGSGTANTLEAESTLTFDSNGLKIHGSKKLYFGDSGTFQMNFSTHTFIEHTSTSGTFYIQGDTLKITNKDRDEIYIECDDEAGVKLKYANTTRCETTSTGVSVTGTVAATAFTGDGSALTGIAGGVTSDGQGNTVGGTNAGDAFSGTNANANTIFGYNAGTDLDTGDNNVFIGYEAGANATSSGNAVAVGYQALYNMGASRNFQTAVGYQALYSNAHGQECTAVGYQALRSNSSGDDQCAFGVYSLKDSNGANNTAFGYKSLMDVSSGSQNAAFGSLALENNTGSSNCALGYKAGDTLGNGSNNIFLGQNTQPSSTTVSNEVTIGDANITKFRIPGINFVLKDNGGTPSSGQVLTADGSGEGYWATASGTTINNNADNRIITGSASANTLEGESTFTYDGSALKVKSTHSLASYVQRTDGVWGNWSPEFNFKATGASPAGTTFGQWGNHAEGHQIVFVKSRNNGTSGTTCQAGDDLGSIFWSPYNSANPGCAAAVKVMASGAYSSTSNPAYMQIMTTPDGSKEPTERVRIGSHGGVIFKGGPLQEKVKITAGKLSNNTNIDLADGNVHYFTTQESTTSTPNLRVNSTIMLNSVMEVGETVAVTLITTAAAGGYSAALQIHGNTQTVNWVGGSAPSAGGSSGVDIYNYTIIKTGSSAFTVIGNLTKTS